MDKLLSLLETNGRATPEELADSLDVSVQEVKEKIKEYEEKGIIRGYKAVINREKLERKDAPVNALIEVTTAPEPDTGFEAVADEISELPEVHSCYLCSGDYDLLVRVQADDMQEIAEFVATELAPRKFIQGTVSHFLLRTYKEDNVKFDGSLPDQRMSISL
ncbi:MAG: Lrp/AsnC family transcriptional regulator [bacterium]